MIWKLCTAVYGLEEAMVEFDTYLEEVACGRTGHPSEEGLRMKRLVSEPGVYYYASLGTATSKHVYDGIITGPGDNPDKVPAMLGNTFVLKIGGIGGGTTYLGISLRKLQGRYA